MQAIDDEMTGFSAAETRWIEHWLSAVEKVQQLYWPSAFALPCITAIFTADFTILLILILTFSDVLIEPYGINTYSITCDQLISFMQLFKRLTLL